MFKKIKKGALSIPFVIASLAGVILFNTIMNEYNNSLVIRNLEATSDLAAVEALRAYVDEASLRDEKLVINEEDLPELKSLFLEKIRDNLPSHSYAIVAIGIPTVDDDGNAILPSDLADYVDSEDDFEDVSNAIFPLSLESAEFEGPYYTNEDARIEYFVGGYSTDVAAFSIVKDTTNLATSGEKDKTSYILTSKITIVYKTTPLYNIINSSLLNYVDILSDNTMSIQTDQIDDDLMAVTLQAIGKVTLR